MGHLLEQVEMKKYFIMDGRANYNVDDASVVEAFSSSNDKRAKKYMDRYYEDEDVVLVDAATQEVIY